MFFPNDETSSASGKPSSLPTNRNSSGRSGFRRSKTDLHLTPQSFLNYHPPAKSCWGKPRMDPQVKMRLYQWAPKKPPKESEGVQQRLSCLLERSNSAHEISSTPPEPVEERKEQPPEDFDAAEKIESEVDLAKNLIEFLEKSKTERKRSLSEPSQWKSKSDNSKRWIVLPKSAEEESSRKPVVSIIEEEAETESENGKPQREEDDLPPREKIRENTFEITRRSSRAGLGSTKKPSEIPLRKTTPPTSKRPKPVSLLMQKPLDEVDSVGSIDFNRGKKSIREFGPPDSPTENLRAKEFLEEITEENLGDDRKADKEDASDDIRLNRCIKSSNITIGSDFASDKPAENPAEWKVRKLDLEKVKSSSLTILNSNTLSRLESLHQQNVSAKENLVGIAPSKIQILGQKSSFNALRRKGSKKNLSSRLSSKGNKPALKNKAKVKKESEVGSLLQKKKSNEESSETQKKKMATTKSSVGSRRKENASSEAEKTNVEKPTRMCKKTRTVGSPMGLRGVKTPEKTEPPKSPSAVPAVIFEKETESRSPPEEEPTKKEEVADLVPDLGGAAEDLKPDVEVNIIDALNGSYKSFIISSSKEKLQEEKPGSAGKSSRESEKLEKNKLEADVSNEKKPKAVGWKKKSTSSPPKVNSTKLEDLVVRGTGLRFVKEKPPPKPTEHESEKAKLRIDMTESKMRERAEMPEDGADTSRKSHPAFNWLFMNPEKCNEELYVLKESSNDSDSNEDDVKDGNVLPPEVVASKVLVSEAADSDLKKSYKSSSSLKRKLRCKTSALNVKAMSKKKLRSDAGDRRLATGYFNSAMSFKNKAKPDAKLRSGLTKSYREVKVASEKKDIFEDTSAVKLRRRNSEPHSFRGFVWKRADLAAPRTNKTSASSMASSLRHLNTDELEDFIFWEVVPQKVTQCWETSLYHFKRPWSVLSCSVFQDNRQSSTPGLILANLRNGGASAPSKRSPACETERVSCPQENSFDVEPSIAQKNIDIRNWLAALNFPTVPSTSNDVISEGSCCSQSSIIALNWSKNQVSPKRRNVPTGLKFPDEVIESKPADTAKTQDSKKWNADEMETDFGELIAQKSVMVVDGTSSGLETSRKAKDNGETSYDKKSGAKKARKKSDPRGSKKIEDLKSGKSKEGISDPDTSIDWMQRMNKINEDERRPPPERPDSLWVSFWKSVTRKLCQFSTEFNVWKYLFLFTLFFFTVYFAVLSDKYRIMM